MFIIFKHSLFVKLSIKLFLFQIMSTFSNYILANKNKLFDARNLKVAIVQNDQLGKAFGVQAFARCQAV